MKKRRSRKGYKKTVKKPYKKIDWSPRYGDIKAYKILCARVHAATGNKCVVCMRAKSEVVHHSRYLGKDDKPGINVFSTCVRCHLVYCHSRTNWVTSRTNPLWENHNVPRFEAELQANYALLNRRAVEGS